MSWQKRIGEHWRRVHQHLVQHPWNLVHVQADELRIKIQGQVLWLASVIHVSTRLWLGAIVSPQRDEKLIRLRWKKNCKNDGLYDPRFIRVLPFARRTTIIF